MFHSTIDRTIHKRCCSCCVCLYVKVSRFPEEREKNVNQSELEEKVVLILVVTMRTSREIFVLFCSKRNTSKYLQLEHVNDYVSSRKLIDLSLPRIQIDQNQTFFSALFSLSLSRSLLFMSNIRFFSFVSLPFED